LVEGKASHVATRAVFFDLYDTLLQPGNLQQHETQAVRAFNQVALALGIKRSLDTLDQIFGHPVDRSAVDEYTIFERRISEFLRRSGWPHSDAMVRKGAEVILESWDHHWALDPLAELVLEALQGDGFAIALVTNFDHHPYVRSLAPRLGIDRYFDSVVVSGEVGFDKPSPEIFRIALRELSVSANHAVHIGDSEVDVLGAIAAGITPIQIVSSPDTLVAPTRGDHATITSLAEVPELVRTLLG
jgi:HAD superfamily hydrolase (TIGR01509 family)